MAERAVKIGSAEALALAIAVLVLGSAAMVGWRAGGLKPADWQALRFTVLQAGMSAGLSVVLAIPVARALFRRRFRGRSC